MDDALFLLNLAKRHIGTLRAELNYHLAHPKERGDDELLASYWRFHRAITDGKTVLRQLSTFLEARGGEPEEYPDVITLGRTVDEAFVEKSKLDDMIFTNQKRGSLVAFKRSVATVFETGQAPAWISRVSRVDIVNHGGEINRLYQLLIEGQSTTSLAMDSLTLERASKRADLFSEKQRKNLRMRSKEIEALTFEDIAKLIRELDSQVENQKSHQIPVAAFDGPKSKISEYAIMETQWACRKCTYRNTEAASHCVVCGTSHEPEPMSFVVVAKQRRTGHSISALKDRRPSIFAPAIKPVPKRIHKGGGYPIWIRNCDVAEFIGPQGKNASALKIKSGASFVSADQDRIDANGMCPIVIKGTADAIQKAVVMIEKKFGEKEISGGSESGAKVELILWMNNTDVPRLIGPSGANVQGLKDETGTSYIYADQDKVDSGGQCPVRIGGVPEAVHKAAAMIKEQFIDQGDLRRQESTIQNKGNSSQKATVLILNADVPELIGPRGSNVQSMKRETGVVSITAWQERVGSDGMCPIEVKGSQDAVRVAVAEIVERFYGQEISPPEELVRTLRIRRGDVTMPATDAKVSTSGATVAFVDTIRSNRAPASESAPTLDMPMHTGFTGSVSSLAVKADSSSLARSTSLIFSQQYYENGFKATVSVNRPATVPLMRDPTSLSNSTIFVDETKHPNLAILEKYVSCLTCSPESFQSWLLEVHIGNLEDLAEALEDQEFASQEMQPNGLKYFKRLTLRKKILEQVELDSESALQMVTQTTPGGADNDATKRRDAPFELLCPIRHELMVSDPVLARDGYTYEREGIESWFAKSRLEQQGTTTLSPMTGEELGDLILVPNAGIRTMARDFARHNQDTA
jgi:rubrerythrin